ncbi:MAG: acetyl-CoA carboxylase biotin carboxyl carrier protein [Bacteroidia bacterium]|nr:acetyl-CoA carboxylase biotin carboxyl carrier protein [Bacteroidia bacterium]
MKLSEIQDLIKFVAKSGVSEVELQNKDFKIIIKTGNGKNKGQDAPVFMQAAPVMTAAPVQQVAPATATPVADNKQAESKKETVPKADSKLITIKSPMIGTFYRQAGPDKPAFVNVGDEIKPGKVVCIIEAMKLFNEIEAEISGRIVKVLVDDATPVEYDQPLFLVEPN